MSWTLEWSWVAEHRDLMELDWHAAERIDAALIRLAATGNGPVVQIDSDDPNRFFLRVKGAEARLFLNARARAIHVVRIFRRR